MSHKTAYELRFDMLTLAYNILCHNSRVNSIEEQKNANTSAENFQMYDSKKIDAKSLIELAEEMNEFVSNDNK